LSLILNLFFVSIFNLIFILILPFKNLSVQGYLHRRQNLHVALNAHVEKILFDDYKRAIGVVVNHRGKRKKVFAQKEVILSAGAVATPQLLMLSGVGPAEHLKYHKV